MSEIILLISLVFGIFLSISLAPLISAYDQIMIPQSGDDEFCISYNFGDDELNTFFSYRICGNGICESGEDCASCPGDCGVCPETEGGGGGGGLLPPRYYDVIVDVAQNNYTAGDTVYANLTMIFISSEPPPKQDGILEYYLANPKGEKALLKKETIKEGNLSKEITRTLPLSVEEGQWSFQVIWTVKDLPSMNAIDTFEVTLREGLKIFWLIPFGLLLMFLILKDRGNEE